MRARSWWTTAAVVALTTVAAMARPSVTHAQPSGSPAGTAPSTAAPAVAGPTLRVYKRVDSTELFLHVFAPAAHAASRADAAILLFHGGGWEVGQPEWTYDEARRFARLGLVAVAVQYRLSDQHAVTPLDAAADARDAVRWVRAHASELGVDPRRVAAYGASAGAHLAASAAFIPEVVPGGSRAVDRRAVPDALVLLSPAVAVGGDGWFRRLLGTRATGPDASPDGFVRPGVRVPPMLLLVGALDSITPAPGVSEFCRRARAAGGRCELRVYPALGHLLSRRLSFREQESGPFDPDPAAVADAEARTRRFLRRIGYLRPDAGRP